MLQMIRRSFFRETSRCGDILYQPVEDVVDFDGTLFLPFSQVMRRSVVLLGFSIAAMLVSFESHRERSI